MTVTEDYMLLGVGVIAVATFILYVKKWEQVKHYILITFTLVFVLCVLNVKAVDYMQAYDNILSH